MNRRNLLCAALAACLLAAGCAVSDQKETATYRRVIQGEHPETLPAWQPDQPLPLTQAMAMAVREDERLALAGESYVQALIAKDRAAADFLPTVAFVPVYTQQPETKYAAGNPLISQFAPAKTFDEPVKAGMQLNPVHDWTQVEAAARTAEAQRHLLLDLKATVLLDVARSYYSVLEAQRRVAVLQNSLAVQQQRVKDMRAKAQAGVVRPLDVAQSEAQAADTQVRLRQAQSTVRTGRATLAFLVGAAAVNGPLQDDLTLPPWAGAGDEAAWLTLSLQHREDLQAALAAVASAAQSVQSAWAEYFPTVSLDITHFLTRQTFPDDVRWMGMAQVYVPLFTAGLIHADVRAAASSLRAAQLRQARLVRQVRRDLEVALEDLSSSLDQVHELRVQVGAAQKADDAAASAFTIGSATNLDRVVAQDVLLSAQLNLATQEMASKIDFLNLMRVAGELDVHRLTLTQPPATLPAPPAAAPPRKENPR